MNYTITTKPNQPPILNFTKLTKNTFTPTQKTKKSTKFNLYK